MFSALHIRQCFTKVKYSSRTRSTKRKPPSPVHEVVDTRTFGSPEIAAGVPRYRDRGSPPIDRFSFSLVDFSFGTARSLAERVARQEPAREPVESRVDMVYHTDPVEGRLKRSRRAKQIDRETVGESCTEPLGHESHESLGRSLVAKTQQCTAA